MKVVHAITRLDFGGAQQNTLYTASQLSLAHFDVWLVAGPGGKLDAQAVSLAEKTSLRLKFFPEMIHPIHPILDVVALLQLFQFFKQEAPDLVHTHSSKAGILGRFAAWMARVPVIIHTYHGFGFHKGQSWLLRKFLLFIERLACAVSHQIIFVSQENQKMAEELGIVKKGQGVVIRSGVRLSDYPAPLKDRGTKKASLGCGMHKPLIVSVGNLKPQKNPLAFVRVAAKALAANPDLRFLFVGDGELRSRVEAQVIAQHLHGKVFFPGWRQDVPEILAAADIFVLTSIWEGLPRALVEAMKTGLPSVCYATDGIRDLIRDGQNGFLVNSGDEEAMTSRIIALANDLNGSQQIGKNAAASIGAEFDIDGMVRRQEELYAQMALQGL